MLAFERIRKIIFDCVLLPLLLASLSVFLFSCSQQTPADPSAPLAVEITVNNEPYARYLLTESGEYPILEGKNVLVIEGGSAYMKSADCPDKYCVKRGEILIMGEQIICLPNRVKVEVIAVGD